MEVVLKAFRYCLILVSICNFYLCDNVVARDIVFAGQQWTVRSWAGGPGGSTNQWSDSPQSVWVDSSGHLHLKLRQEEGIWKSVQVNTINYATYGKHRFYVEARLDQVDVNVVVGLFLYKNDATELDIEFTVWNSLFSYCQNGSYAIQPSSSGLFGPCDDTESYEHFKINQSGTYSTHYIDWQQNYVTFLSMHGHYAELPSQDFLVHERTFTRSENGNIPYEYEGMRVYINIWVKDVEPREPSDGNEYEIIVHDADISLSTESASWGKIKNIFTK
jgi:hypothetical protein